MTLEIVPYYTQWGWDPWSAFVAESICIALLQQTSPKMAGSFSDRIRKISSLIEDFALELAESRKLSDDEYAKFIEKTMHHQLPFLDAATRKALAYHLIAQWRSPDPWEDLE